MLGRATRGNLARSGRSGRGGTRGGLARRGREDRIVNAVVEIIVEIVVEIIVVIIDFVFRTSGATETRRGVAPASAARSPFFFVVIFVAAAAETVTDSLGIGKQFVGH
ncbi:hypothetical protein IJG21_01145 [Candidatus Saccharibacteria bacterium]|nr:hypothetical protein [Candidatus Saccharibacteria bacterium]